MIQRLILVLLVAVMPGNAVRADWPSTWKKVRKCFEAPNCWRCVPKWCPCPDDYCKKPLPGVACAPTGCCDDYCKKLQPCVRCVATGCCDDYCRKTLPPCPTIGPGCCYPAGTCEGCCK